MIRQGPLISFIFMTGGLLAALPATADPFLPVPPASFLDYHVSTARGLSEEVARDVTVRARLARHFGMSASAFVSYARRNLVVTTLTKRQARCYRVACIGLSGHEYIVTERLSAGTPIFALAATGQPILRLACGNPLVTALPPVPHVSQVKAKPAVLAKSPAILAETIAGTSPLDTQKFFPATSIPSPEVGTAVFIGGMTQPLRATKGRRFLPVVFGAGGVGLVAGSYGSKPHGAPVPLSSPSGPSLGAVPEPSTLLLGILGLVMLGMQAKPSRRN